MNESKRNQPSELKPGEIYLFVDKTTKTDDRPFIENDLIVKISEVTPDGMGVARNVPEEYKSVHLKGYECLVLGGIEKGAAWSYYIANKSEKKKCINP